MKFLVFILAVLSQLPAQNIQIGWSGNKAAITWDETLADSTAGAGERPFSVLTGPYIAWLTDTTARIAWEVIAEKSVMDTSPYFVGTTTYPFAKKMAVRSAKLTGLKPDSTYRYQLSSSGTGWTYNGPEFTFRTLPAPTSRRLRFAIIGDTQRAWSHPLYPDWSGTMECLRKLSRLIAEWNPPLVLHMGDVSLTANGIDSSWGARANWFGVLNNMMPFMHSSFLAITPGNHDYNMGLMNYFGDLYRLETTGTKAPYYYSFDAANVHFMSYSGYPSRTESNAWLDPDLAANRNPWKILFGHYPIHSVGFFNTVPEQSGFWSLVPKYGVQLHLCGHDHSYQRSRRITADSYRTLSDSGMTEIISGGLNGGFPQYALPTPYWNLFHTVQGHYIRAEVEDTVIFFTAIDEDGQVMDRWKMNLRGQPETVFDGAPFAMADDKDTMTVKYNDPWTVTDAVYQRWSNPSWTHNRLNGDCFRSSSSYSNKAGDFVEFTFTGTSVAWIGSRSDAHGMADVYIDGVLDRADVDAYVLRNGNAGHWPYFSLYQREVYTKSGLTNGAHTIRIVVTGRKNAASSNTYVDIDAFRYSNGASTQIQSVHAAESQPDAPVTFFRCADRLAVKIRSAHAHRVDVVDVKGVVVKRYRGSGSADYTLSKQGCAPGVYFIRALAADRRFVRTVVFQ